MFLSQRQKKRSYKVVFLRIAILVTLFIIAVVTPWWISAPFAIILVLFFNIYEAVFVGILLDAMYAHESLATSISDYAFTTVLLLSVTFSWFLTGHMRGLRE